MRYDPYSLEMQNDPYPVYRHFRDEEPCTYNEEMGFYALFRFEDVWQATLDWETYSSSLGPTLDSHQIPPEAFSIIGMDPPQHTRLRNLVSRGFTPRRIEALEPEVRAIARGYLSELRDSLGESRDSRAFDIQQEFSVKLPMDVISLLLGIPEADRDTYRGWVDRGLERDPETGLPHEDGMAGMMQATAYILDLLKERRKRPREDMITLLATTEYEAPEGGKRPLTDGEVAAFCGLLAAAGAETTAKLIGNAIVYLYQSPEQRKLIFDDEALIPNAIEELLRFDAPSQFQGRVMLREAEMHGVRIPEGARVALVTGAACRDEREFDDPDRLDVTRKSRREIYFGYGQHFCIGKSLARIEARVALEELAGFFPEYRVDEAGLVRTHQAHVRGFKNIPVEV